MDPFAQAVSKIIKEQQQIIGPVALDQAKKVSGLKLGDSNTIVIEGNKKEVLTRLVNQYSQLFGQASIDVCKAAFEPFSDKISPSDVPDFLKN